ncbi:MAG: glycosyltransferase family 4 protein [Thermodesulfobacteriota bacterium]|nr:glycosyltransferase family 4 protein [Thermodesulfobacteriota bacterium]
MKFNILHTEWSEGWGGQEIRILLDSRVLTDMGHRVTILARPHSEMARKAREIGIRVIEKRIKHAYDLPALRRLVALFKKEGVDVVNTHSSVDSWVASAAAKLAGVPVLIRTRHLSVPVATHPFNIVYRWPDGIVTTAEMIRRRMIEVNGLDKNRIVSIPTGVDLTRFDPKLDPGDLRSELGLDPGHRVVTMVAVLRSWKRHEIFLEAFALVSRDRPELRYLVAGEGPRRKNIEAKIRELGLEDKGVMTGYRTDIPRILAISDVCALTSESSEGVPQSVLQYQAMARPVIASAVGGVPEVIEDNRTGLLCPVNDPEAVARGMARLLDDNDLARSLGANARRRVEKSHSLKTMAASTLDFYERLYKEKTGNAA